MMKTFRNQSACILATLSIGVFALTTGSAIAMDTYTQDSSKGKVVNSAGECWQTVGGTPGLCGEKPPMDSDGDGVYDDKDQCPGTPKGVKVDAKGCPLDSDGDGVIDSKDQCPGTPKGVKVDMKGCPLDTDGDGVLDYKDKCPGTPQGAKVDANGCMEQIVLRNVNFETNSANLTMEAKQVLAPIAGVLKGRPDVKQLTITGHTDSRGSEAYNQRLSQARAESVANFFRQEGVQKKVVAVGKGESSPVADNGTPEGRAENRRVELEVMR